MMVGMATFTTVASTMIIDTPRLSTASPNQRRRPAEGDVPAGRGALTAGER
jgi:hypothetical protein